MKKCVLLLLFTSIAMLISCSSSEIKDLAEIIDGVERKTIDVSRMGVNAFANQPEFGSIPAQYKEVRDTLGLRFVRILFNWNDAIQAGPNAPYNFSFYDDILNGIPAGVDALVVLNGTPSWMSNSANLIDGNPRTTFVELWVKKVAQRYKGNGKIIAYQIGNEADLPQHPDNGVLGFIDNPENYVEMLARAYSVVKDIDQSKLVLNASTGPINSSSPRSITYNERLKDLGILEFLDVYAIHYYGKQYERYLTEVKDFLKSLGKPIWVTESGIQGVQKQLPYVEEVWPFLREHVAAIDRIYYYRFAENSPADNTYGLRNPDKGQPVSDLYVHLRERAAS